MVELNELDRKTKESLFKKPFVLIYRKEEFDKIKIQKLRQEQEERIIKFEKNDNQDIDMGKHSKKREEHPQEIIIPRVGKIPKITKKSLLSQSIEYHGYHHTLGKLALPNPNIYELTENDLIYIKQLRKIYKFEGKTSIDMENLFYNTILETIKDCQYQLHQKSSISMSDPPQKIITQLEFDISDNVVQNFNPQDKKKFTKMITSIIKHWKTIKQYHRYFCLLRKYWPRTPLDQYKFEFFIPYKSRFIQKHHNQVKKLLKSNSLTINIKQQSLRAIAKQLRNYRQNLNNLEERDELSLNNFINNSQNFHSYADSLIEKIQFDIPEQIKKLKAYYNKKQKFNSQYIKINTELDSSILLNHTCIKILPVRTKHLNRKKVYQIYYKITKGFEYFVLNDYMNENSQEKQNHRKDRKQKKIKKAIKIYPSNHIYGIPQGENKVRSSKSQIYQFKK